LGVLISVPLLAVMLLYFRFVFGFFIRHFERQADQYVFVAQGTGQPLIASFEKIVQLGGGRREEKNWHHFGMGERIENLERCERDRSEIDRHDRRVRFSLAVYFLLIGLSVLGLRQIDTEHLSDGYETKYAEAVLLQKERLEPTNSLWPILLGDLLQSRKLEHKAVAAYERALMLSAENAEVKNNLAWLLLTAQDPSLRDAKRALDLAREAVLLREHGHILDTLATALWANNRVEEALMVERQG
jgi:tetratricopeptide (TPR) repeat protein